MRECAPLLLALALSLWPRAVTAEEAEPAWWKRVLFDADASLPRLGDGTTALGGDLLLGYRGDYWGIIGTGGASSYDFVSTDRREENRLLGGGLEAWVNTGGRDARWHLEARAAGRGSRYRTNTLQPNSDALFDHQVSNMARALLALGARYEEASRWGVGAWVSAAGQHEVYQRVDVAQTIDAGQTSTTTLLLEGRLRAHVAVFDSALRLRLSVDATRFHLTRDALGVSAGDVLSVVETAADSTQVTVLNRLYVDVEALRFLMFVPTAHLGFDVVSLHVDGAEAVTTVVPLGGIGIRSDGF
jgi:hypothetical protein